MTRRILISLIALLVLLCGIAVAEEKSIIASGNCGASGSNLSWTLDSTGKLTISGKGEMADYRVGEVPWFNYYNSIQSVVIQEGVSSIGSTAFMAHSNMTSIELPSTLTVIDGYSFFSCNNLSSITLPEGITSIDAGTFSFCENLTSITILGTVHSIGKNAFDSCTSLSSVSFPEGLTSIDSNCFRNCTLLISATLPESVSSIAEDAFDGCSNLLRIYAPEGSYAQSWAEGKGMWGSVKTITANGIEYSLLDAEATVTGYEGESTNLVIPAQVNGLPVTRIGNRVFKDCDSLTNVVLPEGIVAIGMEAYANCSMNSITLPTSLRSLSEAAFSGCCNLTSIVIPESITYIPTSTFSWCESLTSVTIPKSVTFIAESAFGFCYNLTNIVLPQALTGIDLAAFDSCESLTSIAIPDSVSYIGPYAFSDCFNLTDITLPSRLTSIDEGTFWGCDSLTTINIPNSVTSIGDLAFYDCFSLTSITIPEGVTYIGDEAFYYCDSLTSITIPASVSYIGSCAFGDCSSLEKILFRGSSSISIEADAIPTSVTICCYRDSAVDNWATGKGYTVEYIDGHVHTPVTDAAVPATHVTSGLTEGSHCSVCGEVLVAQQNVPMVEVSEIIALPAELKTIEAEAFAGDTFVCVVLPDGCKAIGAGAFKDCTQLRFVEIPASVTSIDSTAFENCGEGLVIVTVSESEAARFAQEHNITCVLR